MSDGGEAAPARPRFALRLFVAGSTPRSLRTIANLRAFCRIHLADDADVEVVDIYQQPELAARDQVVAAPMLLKRSPEPVRRIIGDLSNESRVLRALGLADAPTRPEGT